MKLMTVLKKCEEMISFKLYIFSCDPFSFAFVPDVPVSPVLENSFTKELWD